MEFGVPVPCRYLQFDGDATKAHRLAGGGVSHLHGLFINRTAASGADAFRSPQPFPWKLPVLAHHERRPSSLHAKEEAERAKVAILDPQLIGLHQIENLRNHTTLLGMTIFIEQDIGNEHALLIQHHEGLAGQRRIVSRNSWRRCAVAHR